MSCSSPTRANDKMSFDHKILRICQVLQIFELDQNTLTKNIQEIAEIKRTRPSSSARLFDLIVFQ